MTFLRRAVLLLYAVLIVAPLYFVAVTVFKSSPDFYAHPLGWPLPPTLVNLGRLFREQPLWTYFFNSVQVTAGTVLLVLLLGSMIAYAIVRFRGRTAGSLFMLFAAGLMVPSQVNMLTIYDLARKLSLSDRLLGLILVSSALLLPLAVFMLSGFMKLVSRELLEAGSLDGCGEWSLYWRIAVPLVAPSLASTAAFLLVIVWNDLLIPMLLLGSKSKLTLPLAILQFRGEYVTDYPMLLTGVLITSLPLVVLFLFLQRYFITGLSDGALKG
ncbi:carbohydrate ABC transporter permease ['Paenibacillus yunnanensis' Narsing Rao et al. 2020]|uniref:carbohydrate ABC transporter permease n=1 Tax=Paenibacillus tengchongensis TaxID=2608684 RepID=UPI00124D300E|nr:carbohydrate ABC transporter permease [Paenibacillus tengchongensis]